METNGVSMSYKREEQRLIAIARCHIGFVDSRIKQAIKDYLKKEGW